MPNKTTAEISRTGPDQGAGRPLVHPEPGRPGRRGHQGGAPRRRRRNARLGTALDPGRKASKRRDSAYFGSANRGKKSITIDFTTAQGQALVRQLAADCDVLVENYKTGTLARYGLGYEDLKAVNPGLVYCSVTGFGHTGPYRHKPGYDFVFQAMSGLMSITGERDDLPGGGPQKVGIAVADITTGMYSTVAVLAALLERESHGRGQHLDMALLDCAMAFNSNQAVNYMASGSMPRRYGNAHSNAVPYQVFDTRDGQIVVAVGNDALFAAYCRAAQRPDLCADARFVTVSGRLQNRDELLSQLAVVMAGKTSAQWLAVLDAAGVPAPRSTTSSRRWRTRRSRRATSRPTSRWKTARSFAPSPAPCGSPRPRSTTWPARPCWASTRPMSCASAWAWMKRNRPACARPA